MLIAVSCFTGAIVVLAVWVYRLDQRVTAVERELQTKANRRRKKAD